MTEGITNNRGTDPNTIIHMLAEVCHLERRRSRELLNEVGLHRGWHGILSQLWREDGLKQTDLVRHGRVQAATVSKTAQRLEEAGLITRRRDDVDQRVVRVYLTDEGRALQDAAGQLRPRVADEALAGLSQGELATLERILGKVRGNLRGVIASRRGTRDRSSARRDSVRRRSARRSGRPQRPSHPRRERGPETR